MTNEDLVQCFEPIEFKISEKEFKTQFISNFLSTWVANNYDDACRRNDHGMLNTPPVEDADFLANKAWEHWIEIMGEQ